MRSVEVQVNTLGGKMYTFKDVPDTPNAGSTALTQLGADEMIHSAEEENGEMYIPFHAINFATVRIDNSLTAPVDDLCKGSVDCSGYHYYSLNMQNEVGGLSDTVTMSEARMIVFCSTNVIPDGPAPADLEDLNPADVTAESSAPDIISISPTEVSPNMLMVTANNSGTATLTLTTADGCVKEITVVRA